MGSKKHLSLIDAYVFESAKKSTDKVLKKGIEKQATDEIPKERTQEIVSDQKVINRSSDQVDNWSSDQAVNRSTDQLSSQLTDQLITQVDSRSTDQQINKSSDQVINRASDQQINKPTDQVINRSTDQVKTLKPVKKPPNLTDRQLSVLKIIYHNRPFKIHGPNGIGATLGIGAPNVRNQIKSLVNKGYINKPYSINDGVNVGSTCRVVEEKCKPLFGDTSIVNPSAKKSDTLLLRVAETDQVINWSSDQVANRPTGQVINRSTDQVDNRSSDQSINSYNSSSSSFNKITTTAEVLKKIETDPELGYWRHRQLTAKQIINWSKEFQISIDSVIESLRHCRFDLVDNELEQKKSIGQPFDWFYKRLVSVGIYQQPPGYKSHQDKEIERNKERIDKLKRQAAELKKLREEEALAMVELEFEQMMQQPESEMYKKCFENIAPYAKRADKIGSKLFINAMRKVFIEQKDVESEGR